MSNSPNNSNDENVWLVDTEYNVKPGNRGNVKAKPGQIDYLSVIAATPRKQVKKNPYNQIGQVTLGYRGQEPKTPPKQKKPVAYGGRRKTRKTRKTSRKTIKRRN
jgi:hypothetical protein